MIFQVSIAYYEGSSSLFAKLLRFCHIVFIGFQILTLITFWPFLATFKRFVSFGIAATVSAEENFRLQSKRNEDLTISIRARIIEVGIEASFQPLLQLYLLLPFLLNQIYCLASTDILKTQSVAEVFESTEKAQFFSVVTSILSLAWSFSYYKAARKRGALDFGVNTYGRIIVFIANVLQITSRLLALVLYAYCYGPGYFWPMILTVILHIILMSSLHFYIYDQWTLQQLRNEKLLQLFQLFYNCVLNGVCNVYIHNRIDRINAQQASIGPCGRTKQKISMLRNGIFEIIFLIENVMVVIIAHLMLPSDLPREILTFIIFAQLLGLLLNCIYYKYFHIWKHLFCINMNISEPTKIFSNLCYDIDHCGDVPL